MKKKVVKETEDTVVYEVEAESIDEFYDEELEERLKVLDETGPFTEHPGIPMITHKQNTLMYIILLICLAAHIWARCTIGL